MNQLLKNYRQFLNFINRGDSGKVFGLILAVQFSTCAEPRLVRYYQYNVTPVEAAKICKDLLVKLDYKIELYDPVGGLVITEPVRFKKDIRQYEYAVVVRIQDVAEIYLVARRKIFKRSSDWSLGGQDLVEKQASDSMPYRIQKGIFLKIGMELQKKGFTRFERKTRLGIANKQQNSQISFHYF